MLCKTTGFVAFLLTVTPMATMAGKSHGGSGGRGGGGSGRKGTKSGGGKYYYDFDIDYSNITCVEDYSCTVGHHGKADNETGSYVCRTSYNLITGDEFSDYKCIASDEAWSTDECGCCGDDCPETPSYVELYCDSSADDRRVLKGGGGGGHGGSGKGDHDSDDSKDYDDEDEVYVCRNLYNPYTGEATTATVTTKNGTALEGDTCGCCDDVCPDDEDDDDDDDEYDHHGRDFDIFDSPDYVEATCSDEWISCDVHDRGHRGRSSNSTSEGLYVCRTSYNTLTGVADQRTQCVSSNRTLEADECGCCDGNCPNEKEEIECADDDVCTMDNGDSGYYVCRTVHHPVTGDEIASSVCIASDHAFSTDVCGCCDSNCTSTFTSTSSSSSTVTWSVTASSSSESSSSAAFWTGSFALLSVAGVGAWTLL